VIDGAAITVQPDQQSATNLPRRVSGASIWAEPKDRITTGEKVRQASKRGVFQFAPTNRESSNPIALDGQIDNCG
jgi:hypothetical protein